MREYHPFNNNPCQHCGKPIGHRHPLSKHCRACVHLSKPRQASISRQRAVDCKPLLVDGQRHCRDCLRPMQAVDKAAPGYYSITTPIKRTPPRCDECEAPRAFARSLFVPKAATIVSKAVRKGLLPRPDTFTCVDCKERQAEVYDHRDYNFPLRVEPVCRSCNVMRGTGVFPHPFCIYGAKPAVPCLLCLREQEGSYFASVIRQVHYCGAGIHISRAQRAA